jgi:hypothetical protein
MRVIRKDKRRRRRRHMVNKEQYNKSGAGTGQKPSKGSTFGGRCHEVGTGAFHTSKRGSRHIFKEITLEGAYGRPRQ